MMKVKDFVAKLVDICENYETVYLYGGIGGLLSDSVIEEKVRQYPDLNTPDRVAKFMTLKGKAFGFDCVNVLKAIGWGWNGSKTERYGGVKYASNGVQDVSADGLIAQCKNVSIHFTDIKIGSLMWLPGHVGVYVGNGRVIECTPIWKDGVQYTDCYNVLGQTANNGRYWKRHGLIPWIDYSDAAEPKKPVPMPPKPPKKEAIHVGDKVKVLNPIVYGTNEKFHLWYSVYEVLEVIGDRAVIGIGKTVTAAIHIDHIEKVKGA